MPAPRTTAGPIIRADASGRRKWNAKWSRAGRQVWRTIGPAWMEPDGAGGWRRRKGRPASGHLTEQEAIASMLAMIAEHDADQTRLERDAEERRRRGATLREVPAEWLWRPNAGMLAHIADRQRPRRTGRRARCHRSCRAARAVARAAARAGALEAARRAATTSPLTLGTAARGGR